MPTLIDLAKQTFGKWTVLSAAFKKSGKTFWNCRCECGTERAVNGKHLRNGESTQCRGCAKRKHGEIKGHVPSTEYVIWASMIARCHDPRNDAFDRYGGRGIVVCSRWRESFSNFLKDMGRRPNGMSLDRFPNNDGNYEPSNCRWATPTQQNRNRRDNRILTAFGESRCLAEWAEVLGINPQTIRSRLRKGWSTEMALNGPSRAEGRLFQ